MNTQTSSAPAGQKVSLVLNGEPRSVAVGTRVDALLKTLGIVGGKVAVERNRAIVPRSQFSEVELLQGDEIEIVRFVGGG